MQRKVFKCKAGDVRQVTPEVGHRGRRSGVQVVLHRRRLLSVASGLGAVLHVFVLKASGTSDTRWFHFSAVVQTEG